MRFALQTLETLSSRPLPKPLVKDCLSRGDVAVVIGSPAFAESLRRVLRQAAVVLALEPGDSRTTVLRRITPMLLGRHPSAVILAFPTDCDAARWWGAEADCVLRVESATFAIVDKLRHHDDYNKGLQIVAGSARLVPLW